MFESLRNLFRKTEAPLLYENLIDEGGKFSEWASNKSGNVYTLLEDYLRDRIGVFVTVGPDWLAIEGVHLRRNNGVWASYEKHPVWYKKWVRIHGSGKYGTSKTGGESRITKC